MAMAALTSNQRASAVGEYHRRYPAGENVSVAKADVRAALDALDDYFVTNAAAINSALPTAARTGLTVTQKARLLNAVISARYVTGA